ncbi:hypothetical protein LJC37_04815, partial [Bacteroidales bacterium OttesenSCG-928-E04]|nr:hypothetical protein [Bacteroidales bacterium OttesenSCG-928-E04]
QIKKRNSGIAILPEPYRSIKQLSVIETGQESALLDPEVLLQLQIVILILPVPEHILETEQ